MTPAARRALGLGVAVLLAAIAQSVWANAARIHGAQPDFLTATAIVCALFCDANGGAGVGLVSGLLLASLAAPPHGGFGSLIVSRVLVGFGVGWLEERIERDNPLLAIGLVTAGTALAECMFFLFAPQHYISHWARNMLLTTLYNAALALPLYFLIRRLAGGRLRDEG